MTVSTTNNRTSTAGNGVTTVFSFPNRFLLDADLVVLEVNDTTDVVTTKTLTTHYTVSGAGGAAGGSVTMLVAPATGVTLVIYRDPALTQLIDLINGDDLDVDTGIERGLDRNTLQIQRLRDLVDRSMRLPDGDTSGASVTLPIPVANTLLGWDSTATGINNKVAADLSLSVVTAFANTLLDDSTAAQARTTLGAVGLTGNETIAGDKTLSGATTLSGAVTMSSTVKRTGASTDQGAVNYSAATGTDTYVSTHNPVLTALNTGAEFAVYFANTNASATPTWNPDSLGAKTVKRMDGAALLAGDISGQHTLRYNGTDMLLLNPRHILTGEALGAATATTASPGDNDTSVATTAFVQKAIAAGSVPIQGTHLFGTTAQVQNVTRYAGESGNVSGVDTQSATEADVIWWPTRPVMLRDLYVNLNVAVGGAGQSCTVRVRKNGANDGPTVVISSGSLTGEDTSNTVTAGPGDYLSISVVNTATTGTLTVMGSVRFVDPASGYGISIIPFNALSNNAATRGIYGIGAPGIVVDAGQAFPVAHSSCYLSEYFEQTTATGTVAATASVAAGSGTIKAAAKFSTSETYGAAATELATRIRGLMLTASSWYQLQFAVDGAAVRHRGCWVLKQRGTGAENEIKPVYMSAVAAAQAATAYMRGHGCDGSTTEVTAQFRLTAGVLKNFILLNEGAGVGGQTWTANVRINGVQQLSLVLSGAATVVVDAASSITVAAGDKLSVELVSSATTGTRSIQFACDHLAA